MAAVPFDHSDGATPPARLRLAGLADLEPLCQLFRVARPETACAESDMAGWLEHGGAIMLESDGRVLAALRWREEDGGWRVDTVASLPEERGQGHDRWLMTKVEAYAIRSNIPLLTLELPDPGALAYYRRMGYRRSDPERSPGTMIKRVGGTWQVQQERR